MENPEKNKLETTLLHRTMVLFHRPANWSGWTVLLSAGALAAFVGMIWRRLRPVRRLAVAAALVHFVAVVGDIGLLRSLPQRRLSYGPWKAQALVLALPRAAGAAAAALTGGFLGAAGALLLHVGLQSLGSALLYWGTVVEPARLTLTRLELPLPGLAPGSNPIRVLHISDLHVERLTQREEHLLTLAREAHPDLILITGDYVNLSYNQDPETHRQVKELLQELKAPYGVYATLGSPPVDLREEIKPLFDDLPVQLLDDEWATVAVAGGQKLALLGLDCTHDVEADSARLARLMTCAPAVRPRILLYHSPELMPQATALGLDLYLCGHTHGGQIRLPGYGALITSSSLGRQYVMGHYRRGNTHLYVSRGVGLEGLSAPRIRFFSPPEITLVTLYPRA